MKASSALIFIDFEAYATNPLYPNEIGAIRVQNGSILASFHAFMLPSQDDISKIRGTKVENQFYFTKKITGIVAPWTKGIDKCKPCVRYASGDMHEIADLLKEFCSCSGEHLREMSKYVTVIGSDEELRKV